MVPQDGIEPPTPVVWWKVQGSNLILWCFKPTLLPNQLTFQIFDDFFAEVEITDYVSFLSWAP